MHDGGMCVAVCVRRSNTRSYHENPRRRRRRRRHACVRTYFWFIFVYYFFSLAAERRQRWRPYCFFDTPYTACIVRSRIQHTCTAHAYNVISTAGAYMYIYYYTWILRRWSAIGGIQLWPIPRVCVCGGLSLNSFLPLSKREEKNNNKIIQENPMNFVHLYTYIYYVITDDDDDNNMGRARAKCYPDIVINENPSPRDLLSHRRRSWRYFLYSLSLSLSLSLVPVRSKNKQHCRDNRVIIII